MGEMDSSDSTEDSYCVETELKDILTLNSCTTLVAELIKFILYRKQQLPYTFDRLKYLITKRNAKEKQEASSLSASVERQFKLARDGLTTLELIFDKVREALANPSKGCIREVALVFGSTPMTPKQVYRIHLPEVALTHSSVNHPERRHLLHLSQSVIHSNNLCDMLRKPMTPTNMFVFIKKNCDGDGSGGGNNLSEWFVPKNRYEIPDKGKHFHIKFRHPSPCRTSCGCHDFQIYSDEEPPREGTREEEEEEEGAGRLGWYQACAIFKGFTDVYINGVSAADLWLR